jgi:hypothetical protein
MDRPAANVAMPFNKPSAELMRANCFGEISPKKAAEPFAPPATILSHRPPASGDQVIPP